MNVAQNLNNFNAQNITNYGECWLLKVSQQIPVRHSPRPCPIKKATEFSHHHYKNTTVKIIRSSGAVCGEGAQGAEAAGPVQLPPNPCPLPTPNLFTKVLAQKHLEANSATRQMPHGNFVVVPVLSPISSLSLSAFLRSQCWL